MNSIAQSLLIFLALLLGTVWAVAQPEERPNIIFILTDDQRWDALGHAGNTDIHTPEMDRLAREGAYFRQAIVTTPICAASRASILTGLYERTHKYTFQTGPMREEYMAHNYPAIMREHGYHTGFFGKFGVNYPGREALFDVVEIYDRNGRYQDRRGYYYKTLNGDTVHLTRYTGQRALDFVDSVPTGKPFCLSLSFSAPHAHDAAEEQYFWQETTDGLHRDGDLPGPALGEDKYFEALPQEVREGFNRVRWGWRYDTPAKYQHSVKGYYRMIAGIDLEIARLREKLEQRGLADNTVIILMGDNGYFLGERQLAGKWLMYDNSIRVPLIVHDPRQSDPRDIQQMALNVDVPATLLDLAGIDLPSVWHGQSLMPLVRGETDRLPDRDTILVEHLWEFEPIPPSEAVRTDDWKYLRYVNDHSQEELYHLSDDPREVVNLANDRAYEDVLATMRNQLKKLTTRYADPYSGTPYTLTVETIRKPEGTAIVDLQPEFGWEVPQEAVYQKAYQILVASDADLLEQNRGDLWDSGVVRSSQSVNISYAGKPLYSGQSCHWKVRIFDQDNRLTSYSAPQTFTLAAREDWHTSSNLVQIERISPVKLLQLSNTIHMADFGKAAFGNLEIEYQPTQSETWTIRLGEKLSDGRIDRNPGGHIRYQEVALTLTPGQANYRISLPADQRNTGPAAVALPDSFPVLMPFRYVEIEGPSVLRPESLRQIAYFRYFDSDASAFSSSDTVLNQVWDLCKYSIKATTFAGLYVDGDRERIPYEADAYLNQLSHYGVDREFAIARKTVEYFMEHPTWPTEWQLHVALMFYQDYWYTGDTSLISRYYDELKHKTLVALDNGDGLISTDSPQHDGELMAQLGFADTTQRLRDIVDWPPAQKDTGWELATKEGERDGYVFTPINTVVNCFYYQNLVIMAEFAEVLGKTNEALAWKERAAATRSAIQQHLYMPEHGYYRDGIGTDHGSVHANMLPLAFDITPASEKTRVAEYVAGRGMACSVYGAQYLLEGLYRAGASREAFDLMTDTSDRSWYNMIRIGSTITLEAWDMPYKPNADWNHAWGAAPANIIPRYLWGVRPASPGFGKVTIQPQLTGLDSCHIRVPTIRGPVEGQFERVSGRHTRYSITLPANMVGELILPLGEQDIVTVDGKMVSSAFGSIRLEPGLHSVEVRVNSF